MDEINNSAEERINTFIGQLITSNIRLALENESLKTKKELQKTNDKEE